MPALEALDWAIELLCYLLWVTMIHRWQDRVVWRQSEKRVTKVFTFCYKDLESELSGLPQKYYAFNPI